MHACSTPNFLARTFAESTPPNMQPLLFSLLLSLELSSALRCGSVLGRVSAAQHTARIPAVVSMAKGFGPPPPPPVKKAPSAAKAKRDTAATAFDELKSSGAPEYMISVRTVGAAGPSDWMPVGGIAVPRSNSVDMAVSMAIYNNEEELLKGAKRSYPKLKVERRPRCVRIGRPLHCWQSRAASSA